LRWVYGGAPGLGQDLRHGGPTTNIYLRAELIHKQEAIDRVTPLDMKSGRYRSSDPFIAFLEAL
jgi:hypothetical protein